MRIPTILVGVFLLGTVLATGYAAYSYQAIDLDAIDGTFFMGFYQKLFTPDAIHSINPEGKNIFFFSGTDGATSLHQDIHLEPVKYLFALFVQLFGPYAVMFLIALCVFSPLLYGAYLAREKLLERTGMYLLLAYAAFPAVFFAASSGIRPSALLAPAVLLCFLAIMYKRPLREQLALFTLLFLVREEAILFGIPLMAVAFLFARDRKEALPYAYLYIWAAGVAAFALYILWAGYPSSLTLEKVGRHLPLIPTFVAALLTTGIMALALWRWRTHVVSLVPILAPLSVSLLAGLVTLAHLIVDRRLTEAPLTDLLRANLGAVAMAGVVAAGFMLMKRYDAKPALISSLAIASCAGSLVAQVFMDDLLVRGIPKLEEKREAGELVWSARSVLADRVLADYDTIFAWHDAGETYALERFPASMLPGPVRFYPENRTAVVEYLESTATAMVVSVRNRELAESLAREAGRTFVEQASNERYVWYGLEER